MIKTVNFYFFKIYPIDFRDIKISSRKLLPGDMDEKFLDHNAINKLCDEKSRMELEQSDLNVCAAVKGVLGCM